MTENPQERVSEAQQWLLTQTSFRITGESPFVNEWRQAADELVRLGYVRRSRSGRYWIIENTEEK